MVFAIAAPLIPSHGINNKSVTRIRIKQKTEPAKLIHNIRFAEKKEAINNTVQKNKNLVSLIIAL
jgi:hypothetical protein